MGCAHSSEAAPRRDRKKKLRPSRSMRLGMSQRGTAEAAPAPIAMLVGSRPLRPVDQDEMSVDPGLGSLFPADELDDADDDGAPRLASTDRRAGIDEFAAVGSNTNMSEARSTRRGSSTGGEARQGSARTSNDVFNPFDVVIKASRPGAAAHDTPYLAAADSSRTALAPSSGSVNPTVHAKNPTKVAAGDSARVLASRRVAELDAVIAQLADASASRDSMCASCNEAESPCAPVAVDADGATPDASPLTITSLEHHTARVRAMGMVASWTSDTALLRRIHEWAEGVKLSAHVSEMPWLR